MTREHSEIVSVRNIPLLEVSQIHPGGFSPKGNRFRAVNLPRLFGKKWIDLRGHKRRYGLGKVWLKCAKVLKPKTDR